MFTTDVTLQKSLVVSAAFSADEADRLKVGPTWTPPVEAERESVAGGLAWVWSGPQTPRFRSTFSSAGDRTTVDLSVDLSPRLILLKKVTNLAVGFDVLLFGALVVSSPEQRVLFAGMGFFAIAMIVVGMTMVAKGLAITASKTLETWSLEIVEATKDRT